MNLTEHFTLEDFTKSQMASRYGIDNSIPSDTVRTALLFTAAGLERVKALLGFEVQIHSGYRSEALNKLVGGSTTSQHMKGEAVDFVCPLFGTPFQIATYLTGWLNVAGIDQLIQEGTWVHCSFTHNPRKEVLTKKDGQYVLGIV